MLRARNGETLKNLGYGYRKAAPCPPGLDCADIYHSTAYTGQVTSVVDSGKYNFYSYDNLGRLQRVEQWAGGSPYSLRWSQDYSYDRYGNRTGTASSGNSEGLPVPRDGHQSLAYDSSTNRITSAGFSYDAAGNQLQNNTGQSLIYDAAGRLAKVKDQNQSNATIATYTYGASNQRLITQTGDESSTAKTYYIWDGGAVIVEYTEQTSASMPKWSKNYVYFGGRLLATEEPNGSGEKVYYHHPDRLGTRLVTNNLDTTFFEQVSLPFGTPLDAESTGATNRRFTSYDRSTATGLDYAVNRHYDPKQGRFTQPDPLGMGAASLADPQSLNMYSYVGNDPMNRVDPDGQFWGALAQFVVGLFHSFKPNIINGSFAYHNLPPISVSFTTNFQNIGVGYTESRRGLASRRSQRPCIPLPIVIPKVRKISRSHRPRCCLKSLHVCFD
jgi:RHS repeat-associated protein